MDIHEIAVKYRLPVSKVRRMHADGILIAAPMDEATGKVRAILAKGNRLPVLDLVRLMKAPHVLEQLAPPYRAKAQAQIDALGNVARDSMGGQAATLVLGASIMDPDALGLFVDGLRARVPPGGCDHAYLASRILWDVAPARLEQTNRYLRGAMMNAKNHPALAGWFSLQGTKTIFANPEPLDL